MTNTAQKTQVAAKLVAAIDASDADALAEIFSPDAVVWHSTDQRDMTFPELQGMLRSISTIASATVEQTGLHHTDNGFVLTVASTYRLNDGGTTSFHAAQIVDLDVDHRIVRVDEYLDSAGLDPLVQALTPAPTA